MSQTLELEIGRGEDIKTAINEFINEKGWDFAYISGAVGSVMDVSLSNPQSRKIPIEVAITKLDGPCEVVGFTGEIMKKEYMNEELKKIYRDESSSLFIHIHMSCSTKDAMVYGGGLHQGKTFRGLKIYVQKTDGI